MPKEHPLQSAYDHYMDKLNKLNMEIADVKKMLNNMAKEMGIKEQFEGVTETTFNGLEKFKMDEFVNKSPAASLKIILEKLSRAATWNEIKNYLTEGGFEWAKNGGEKTVRLNVLKNTSSFKYVKNNEAFGLKEWYGESGGNRKAKNDMNEAKGRNIEDETNSEDEKQDE